MCGIVGMSLRSKVTVRNGRTNDLVRCFTKMLVEAEKRGAAATGVIVASLDRDRNLPKIYVVRSPLAAHKFIETDDYKQLMRHIDAETFSVIGHTRAVSGINASAKDNHNNHPHIHGPVIGVHNGRIVNDKDVWGALSPDIKPYSNCDSEAIFALIHAFLKGSKALEPALISSLEVINGWMALAIVNAREPSKVYLFKDRASPLEIGFWESIEVALFASEYSYITTGVKAGGASEFSLTRFNLDPNRIVVLDSSLKGSTYTKLFAGSRYVKENKNMVELLDKNKDAYRITQGKAS